MKVRKAKNAITVLQTPNGDLLYKREEIEVEIFEFHKKLMVSSASFLLAIDLQTIRLGKQLSLDASTSLSKPVTHVEIDQTLSLLMTITFWCRWV